MRPKACTCNKKDLIKPANLLFLLLLFSLQNTAFGYDPITGHVPLTQVAIKKYNQCFRDDNNSKVVTKQLQKRIEQGNIAMDHGSFSFNEHDNNLPYALLTFHYISRITNWHFYHPDKEHIAKQNKFQLSHKRLWGWAKRGLKQANTLDDKALFLGGLIHLTEDLSVPAHVAPVYHGPAVISFLDDFEHLIKSPNEAPLSFKDKLTKIIKDDIDVVVINPDALINGLTANKSLCEHLNNYLTPEDIREQLSRNTLNAINQLIPNCDNTSWSSFWPVARHTDNKTNSAKYFHQYGPAFLSAVDLSQGQNTCKLVKEDQRYYDFLTARYLSAIKANMALIHWFNMNESIDKTLKNKL